jgi:hypothetical protein
VSRTRYAIQAMKGKLHALKAAKQSLQSEIERRAPELAARSLENIHCAN